MNTVSLSPVLLLQVIRLSADSGRSSSHAAAAFSRFPQAARHHHAVITLCAGTQSRMAAADSPAVTAECSDGLPVVADEDCSSRTALRQLGWRNSPLAWHRLAV